MLDKIRARTLKLPCQISRWLNRTIGRRGWVLIMLGWVFLGEALRCLAPEPVGPTATEASRYLHSWLPSSVWGAIFIGATLLCWFGVFRKRWEVHAYFVSAWLWTLYAIGYTAAIFGSQHPIAILRMAITEYIIAAFVVMASTWKEH